MDFWWFSIAITHQPSFPVQQRRKEWLIYDCLCFSKVISVFISEANIGPVLMAACKMESPGLLRKCALLLLAPHTQVPWSIFYPPVVWHRLSHFDIVYWCSRYYWRSCVKLETFTSSFCRNGQKTMWASPSGLHKLTALRLLCVMCLSSPSSSLLQQRSRWGSVLYPLIAESAILCKIAGICSQKKYKGSSV